MDITRIAYYMILIDFKLNMKRNVISLILVLLTILLVITLAK